MKTEINQIIDTLQEGQEITIILSNGEQFTGLFRGIDGEEVVLRSKSGDAPDLGWNIAHIDDIVPLDQESAGDIVQVDIVDVKTGRKAAVTIDMSGEEAKLTMSFIPAARDDESGWYVFFASKFIKALTGAEDDED